MVFAIHQYASAIGYICPRHPVPSHLPPHPMLLGRHRAPALVALGRTSSSPWQFCTWYCVCVSAFLVNHPTFLFSHRVQNAILGCNLKNDRMISVCFQGKPFSITENQVYAPTSNAEEAEVEWSYEDLQDLLELTPKIMSFSSQGTGMQNQEVQRYLE